MTITLAGYLYLFGLLILLDVAAIFIWGIIDAQITHRNSHFEENRHAVPGNRHHRSPRGLPVPSPQGTEDREAREPSQR